MSWVITSSCAAGSRRLLEIRMRRTMCSKRPSSKILIVKPKMALMSSLVNRTVPPCNWTICRRLRLNRSSQSAKTSLISRCSQVNRTSQSLHSWIRITSNGATWRTWRRSSSYLLNLSPDLVDQRLQNLCYPPSPRSSRCLSQCPRHLLKSSLSTNGFPIQYQNSFFHLHLSHVQRAPAAPNAQICPSPSPPLPEAKLPKIVNVDVKPDRPPCPACEKKESNITIQAPESPPACPSQKPP